MANFKVDVKGIEVIANLYITWLKTGRSSNIAAFQSGLALADLLHSAGLLKDSMYGRIGTMADVAFTTNQIGNVLNNSASALRTLAEGAEAAESGLAKVLAALPESTLSKLGLLEAADATG